MCTCPAESHMSSPRAYSHVHMRVCRASILSQLQAHTHTRSTGTHMRRSVHVELQQRGRGSCSQAASKNGRQEWAAIDRCLRTAPKKTQNRQKRACAFANVDIQECLQVGLSHGLLGSCSLTALQHHKYKPYIYKLNPQSQRPAALKSSDLQASGQDSAPCSHKIRS